MGVQNRFFNPAGARYMSQFVPEVLPVDLMTKTLYAKQAKADQMMEAAVKLGEWEHEALGWHDTKYVKDIKNELEGFVQQSMTEDRTSPEFQRRYLELTNRIKNDENLASISSAVATHQAYRENIAKLKASNPDQAEVLEADYMYRLNEYVKEGGQGFKGQGLGDPNIVKGVNEFKDALEFFTPLKDSGGDSVKFLGEGIAYKNGWTGISDKRVKEQAERQYNLFKDTRAGQQLRLRALQESGLVETTYGQLDADTRKKIDESVDNYMRNEFLDVGRTVVHGTSSTNIDTAYNTRRKEDLEKEIGVIIPTNETAQTVETTYKGRDNKIKELDGDIKNVNHKLYLDKLRIKNGLGSEYTKDGLKALEAQQASLIRRRDLLKQERNEDWQNIFNAQKQQVQGKFDDLTKREMQALTGLKGKLSKEDYAFLYNNVTKKPAATSYLQDEMHWSVINDMLDSLPNDAASKETRSQLLQLLHAEQAKDKLSKTVKDKTHDIWNDEYNKVHKVTYTTEMSGASVRTDDKSTMAAVNKDILSNSEVYNFYRADGSVISIPEGATIKNFKGNSVTAGNFRNKGEVGVNGQITYETPVLNAENEKVYNADGSLKTKIVSVAVNAVPVGSRTNFLKQSWANEQFEVARVKEAQGHYDQAAVARGHAMNLNNASNYQDLIDFQASDEPVTSIATTAYSPDGKHKGSAEFVVRKVGDVGHGGGYQVKYGNIVDEFPDVNAVNAYIQTLTNSTPSNQ